MQSCQKLSAVEKPKSAAAVSSTLTSVTPRVPNFFVSRSDISPEIIVPPEIIMETKPMYESGTPKSTRMVGHAEPSSESGRPKLMKARYITARSNVYINIPLCYNLHRPC